MKKGDKVLVLGDSYSTLHYIKFFSVAIIESAHINEENEEVVKVSGIDYSDGRILPQTIAKTDLMVCSKLVQVLYERR